MSHDTYITQEIITIHGASTSVAVQADTSTTTVNISGTVINASCDADVESENQRIDMGISR